LGKNHDFDIGTPGSLIVSEKTLATKQPGIFAGGDVVTGPNTVIDGIAQGRRAAVYIDKYVQGIDIEKKMK
jgi:NADPH-dependent glutamate synthase beta subunit-like oxidoreductase